MNLRNLRIVTHCPASAAACRSRVWLLQTPYQRGRLARRIRWAIYSRPMVRKALCVAWLLGLLTSVVLLVGSLRQPWLLHESSMTVEGVNVSAGRDMLWIWDGSGSSIEAPRLVIDARSAPTPPWPSPVTIMAERGRFNLFTFAVDVQPYNELYRTLLQPSRNYSIPIWPITLAFAIMLVFTYRPLRRSRRRAKRGLCQACGYDLRGLTAHRCPECGTEFAPGPDQPAIAENMEPT